jgi:hypothetical protein
VHDAVALVEHAVRLTPPGVDEHSERLFALAGYLDVAGEPQRVTNLLMPELDSFPEGPVRGRAHLLLSEGAVDVHEHEQHLDRALAESQGDVVLRAHVLAKMSIIVAATEVERIRDAEAWALEALADGPRAGHEVERLGLHGLGWARALRGRPVDDLAERFYAASDAAFHIADSLDRVAACRLAWRGELDEARTVAIGLLGLADGRGEPWSYAVLRMHVCEFAMRAGEWETAVAGAEASGERWQLLQALRVRGIAALLAHDPARAVECLRAVWEHTQREGVEDPGAFPVAPELVEAFVEVRAGRSRRAPSSPASARGGPSPPAS